MESQNEESQEIVLRVFSNEYIAEHIFGFLTFGEIKQCRMVGNTWKNVVNRMMRRRSCVNFNCSSYHIKKFELLRMTKKIKGVVASCKVASNKPENTPFGSFRFFGAIPMTKLLFLTKRMGNFIKELKILGLKIDNQDKVNIPFSINSLIGPYLTKLNFEFTSSSNTFTFSPNGLVGIQDLQLNHCQITTEETATKPLRLKKLTLGENIKYIQNGIEINEFDIHNIFDLRETEDLQLNGNNIILDFARCRNPKKIFRCVFIKDVKFLNWENCDWTFKQLSLNGIVNLSLCNKFANIEDLTVNKCEILADQNEVPLSTNKLTVGNENKFIEEGDTELKFVINKVFDLQQTENILLDGKNIVLDLSYCPNKNIRRCVTLKNITVSNWSKCDWKIKLLILDGVPLLEKTSADVEEIRTRYVTVDFSAFLNPIPMKKIYCGWATLVLKKHFFFPNLNDLTLINQSISALEYFPMPEDMLRLELNNKGYDTILNVKIENFPKQVQYLGLSNVSIEGSGICLAETLCLCDDSDNYEMFVQFQHTVEKFKGKNLLIRQDKIWKQEFDDVLHFLTQAQSFDRIFLGKCNTNTRNEYEEDYLWTQAEWLYDLEFNFNDLQFSKFVNRECKYYVFHNQKGFAIDLNEYQSLLGQFVFYSHFEIVQKVIQCMEVTLATATNVQ